MSSSLGAKGSNVDTWRGTLAGPLCTQDIRSSSPALQNVLHDVFMEASLSQRSCYSFGKHVRVVRTLSLSLSLSLSLVNLLSQGTCRLLGPHMHGSCIRSANNSCVVASFHALPKRFPFASLRPTAHPLTTDMVGRMTRWTIGSLQASQVSDHSQVAEIPCLKHSRWIAKPPTYCFITAALFISSHCLGVLRLRLCILENGPHFRESHTC